MAGFFFLVALSSVVVAMVMGAVGLAGGGWRSRAGFTGCPPRLREMMAEQGHLPEKAGGGGLETALPDGLDVIVLDGKALRHVRHAWEAAYAGSGAPAR